jgi:RNA polymerase sigma-70 factor, ECF subfamily
LYEAESEPMARSLLVIGGDAEAARDAVAEAFSRAYQHWPRMALMSSPAGWVYRVALRPSCSGTSAT